VPGHVEEWHIPEKSQVSECATNKSTNGRITKCSTSDSLGDVSWVQKAAL